MNSFRLYFAAFSASIGAFLLSYATCVIAGALPFLQAELSLAPLEEGLVASGNLLGAFFGTLLGGWLADRVGRKRSLQISSFFFLVSGVSFFTANSLLLVLFLRFTTGIGAGLSMILIPLYLAEIAPTERRGSFVALFQLSLTIGTLAAYSISALFVNSGDWRAMIGVSAVPAALQFIALFFIPESLKWLVASTPLSSPPKTNWKELLIPSFRFALLLGFSLALFQQLSGINAVVSYAPKIFLEAGFDSHKKTLLPTLLMGFCNLLGAILSLILLDKLGRRKLLLISLGGVVANLFLLTVSLATESFLIDQIAAFSLIAYIGFFSLGMGPVTWVLVSEIYPISIRAKAISIANFICALSTYCIVLTFPFFLNRIGAAYTFSFFTLASIVACILFYRYVPETKGKTFEQIQKDLAN